MGKLASTLLAVTLCGTLAACGSEAAEPPPPAHTSTAPSTPTPTASPSPTPPVMPDEAKTRTVAGAKAFVRYYLALITYAEATLDTTQLRAASLPACRGCAGGIEALEKLKRQGAQITGADVEARSIAASAIDAHGVVSVYFDSVNARESVTRPGKTTLIHPAGRQPWLMTLVWKSTTWVAAQYEASS